MGDGTALRTTLDEGVAAVDLMVLLEHSDIVGQAKGILMGRLNVSANEAFDMLARAARAAERPVYELAADLLDRRPRRAAAWPVRTDGSS